MSLQLGDRARAAIAPAIVFVTAIAVYARTMMPGVGFWDTGEYQSVPYLLGIMHNTGYPTYTLVGKLFSLLPVGSVAFRMTLMSAVCAAWASSLLVMVARRLGAGPLAATAAGLAFALHQNFWTTAGKADSHTMHAAFVLGTLLLALRWRETRSPRTLALLALVAALGLGNHMLMAMALPGLALLAILGRGRAAFAPKTLAKALGAGLAGLGVYLYLPIRARMHPAMDYGKPEDWPRFHKLVFASDTPISRLLFERASFEHFLVLVGRLPDQVATWFTSPGAATVATLAAVGAGMLLRRDWRVSLGLLALAFPTLWVAVLYPNGDAARYLFVPTAVAIAFASVGAQGLVDGLARIGERVKPLGLAAPALAAVLVCAPLGLVKSEWQDADHSGDRKAEVLAADVFDEVDPGATVVCEWNEATPLWYKHYVEGLRPDLEVVYETNATAAPRSTLEAGIAARLGRRPVYVLLEPVRMQEVAQRFRLAPVETYPDAYVSLERVTGPRP